MRQLRSILPVGGSLPAGVWLKRHNFLLGLTWFHSGAIALAGIVLGYRWDFSIAALFDDDTVLHTVWEGLIVAGCASLASWTRLGRSTRATFVGLGLMSASAILVHLSGGYIELHFHFFVMIVFLALYQDWIPFGMSILYVATHHGVVGVLWPASVYNHPAAIDSPWTWAGIHAFFVLCASAGSIIAWRFNETAFAWTQRILDSTGEGIFGLDMEGRLTFINPAAVTMLGLGEKRISGELVHEIIPHIGAENTTRAGGVSSILAPFKDGNSRVASDELIWRKDGTSFRADYTSAPIVERDEVTGVVVSFRDVSELKKRIEDLSRSNAELERFAYVASHDLQEPLRIITGYTQLLAKRYRGKLDQDGDEFIGYAVNGAKRMQALINDLLSYSRVGTRGKKFAPTSCETLLQGVLTNLKVTIAEAGAVVTHDRLPAVMADDRQLGQLFQNLIENAIKYRDSKPPEIHVSCKQVDGEWVFSVEDNGIGIDSQYQEKIFVIFQRLHTQQEYAGTGIGLAVCKKIVERHGGRIWVESRAGQGATFYFTVPAQESVKNCRERNAGVNRAV